MATPFLVDRYPGVISMAVANRPSVASYRFGAANTLDLAFAGVTALADVRKDTSFRSPTLVTSALNRSADSRKGQTRFSVDMNDYASLANVSGDAATAYFRVQEIDHSGTARPAGPIMVVPPAYFNTSPYRTLSLTGTAPDTTGTPTGLPPAGVMVISLPVHVDDLTIYNDDSSNEASLFIGLGPGQQEIEVPYNVSNVSGADMTLPFGGSVIYIRGDGEDVPFRLTMTLVAGLR
ncbi:MAG: hypothetical protein CMJ67_10115 [Planctomycetaceae bacterium]|nr:hypothetical protein [Planctomycetaceae bacterium]